MLVSCGIGQQFVRQALDRGAAKVYAGARRDHDWNDERVVPLRLDVTGTEAINAAASNAQDKADPKVIVGRILDALGDGQDEAIADDSSAQVKSILPGVTTGVIPQ